MKINVIGAGFVGQVVASCFSELGHEVWVTDNSQQNLAATMAGHYLEKGVDLSRCQFTPKPIDADMFFICVGTPEKENGDADLSAVHQVIEDIEHLPGIAVLKSTVPPGTCESLGRTRLVMNPEFLAQGTAIRDFKHATRTVLGGDPALTAQVSWLYDVWGGEVIHTDWQTAELCKYVCNGFLATKISFINEMACISEIHSASITTIQKIAMLDPRIGPPLYSGIGYGGSCFPKDMSQLWRLGSRYARLAEDVNDEIINPYVEACQDHEVAIWGLAFKPGTVDVRGSRGLALARRVNCVAVHDPEHRQTEWPQTEELPLANCIAVCTEHPLYRSAKARAILDRAVKVVDCRNVLHRGWRHGDARSR